MLRAIVLSLALLIGLGTLLPLATEMAEAGPRQKRKYKKKKRKGVRKYSKRWWQLRRKKARQRRARAKQRRARKLRRARLARKRRIARKRRVRLARKRRLARQRRARLARKRKYTRRKRSATARRRSNKRRYTKRRRSTTARNQRKTTRSINYIATAEVRRRMEGDTFAGKSVETNNVRTATPDAKPKYSAQTVSPSRKTTQKSWINKGVDQSQLQFNVQDERIGTQFGSAAISVVGPAVENNQVINSRVKTVGGVSTTALRRTVIDQMIREEGWVVNDYEKEVNGKKVYVVVAQAPDANNQVENRMYYFTEADGKIYSVATKAPEKGSEKLAEESEKVIDSLQSRKPVQPQIASNRAVIKEEKNED